MIDTILGLSVNDIKNGYSYDPGSERYICHICGKRFQKGEVFSVDGRFFDAAKTMSMHIVKEHADMLELLVSYDKKYTGLTDNQRDLVKMMHSGMSDNEIAKNTGVTPSTIRHQRFIFREKAKQAKLFLAIYELAFQDDIKDRKQLNEDRILDVHTGAKMVDDRYFTTEAEEKKILSTMFSSLSPLRLKTFSSKEKKKIVILRKISEQFEKDRRYSEKEVNGIIKVIYEDFVTIRRYLIEYGFMERTNDCKEYWLK
ncbi:MAG TPA: DUF2087 domain-containing protein [Clostridia bacterium]|nr:DUF2087 domain-containing protein [Clostridia bacterium]